MLASLSSSSFIQCPLQLASSKTTLGKQLPYTTPPRLRFRSRKTSAACSATTEAGRRPQLNFRTDQMASAASLYEVLGIPMSASCHEIKAAYRKLARICHPDVVAINHKETSANEFIKIHAAYSTLSDPGKRACYDREIYSHRLRPCSSSTMASAAAMATAMSGFSGRTRRNWETDQCW